MEFVLVIKQDFRCCRDFNVILSITDLILRTVLRIIRKSITKQSK